MITGFSGVLLTAAQTFSDKNEKYKNKNIDLNDVLSFVFFLI